MKMNERELNKLKEVEKQYQKAKELAYKKYLLNKEQGKYEGNESNTNKRTVSGDLWED